MRIRRTRYAVLSVVAVALGSVVGLLPKAATADPASLAISKTGGTATVSGVADVTPTYLFVYLQQKTAGSCADTANHENLSSGALQMKVDTLAAGAFTEQIPLTGYTPSAGGYQLCGYLGHNGATPSDPGPSYAPPVAAAEFDGVNGLCNAKPFTITAVHLGTGMATGSSEAGGGYMTWGSVTVQADDSQAGGSVAITTTDGTLPNGLGGQDLGNNTYTVDLAAPSSVGPNVPVTYQVTYYPTGSFGACSLPDGTVETGATYHDPAQTVSVTWFPAFEGGTASVNGVTLPGSSPTPTGNWPLAASVSGTPKVGNVITCNWPLPPGWTATYRWTAGADNLAFTRTLKLSLYDLKLQEVQCFAEWTDPGYPGGSGIRTNRSPWIHVLAATAIRRLTAPYVTGRHAVYQILRAKPGTWSPTPSSYTYQWYAGTRAIAAGHASYYQIPPQYKGKRIWCRVTAHKFGYANGVADTASVLST